MSVNEPFHDPAELLDELDSIIREQELLRLRTIALQARYKALESHADRFDKPGKHEWLPEEYGRINVEYSARFLLHAAGDMAGTAKYGLVPARELAEKIREYPQPEREQADRPPVDRGRSR
ncbi:hypothetical protein OG563_30470 [Nocardia vinacea]|uniref:Phage protein n=1 Tax=Nocardia vinacea TaxID=96468 RepID=A0ABZ1YJX8_9NOCA|nr:hypothetical protein [Nocardia vinacea]